MTEFVPQERGINIRNPSTANLYIDSLDRVNPLINSSSDFIISKQTNILSGFFTRIAINEVVLDWAVPNISAKRGNNTFTATVGTTTRTVTLNDDFYNVKQCLDTLVRLLNTAFGGTNFSIAPTTTGSSVFFTNTNNWTFTETILSDMLDIRTGDDPTVRNKYVQAPKLLSTTYIDITSDSLTYCQNLKDGSTSAKDVDVLYRWYFAWDGETTYDAYGYPIIQGYKPFTQRRSIAFPKQIKWDNIQPIGQLAFRVYNSAGNVLDLSTGETMEFMVSALVSEV